MPILVREITSGQSSERSVDGGFVVVRSWRVILQSPSESWEPQSAVGVYIGDTHPTLVELLCVSVTERPDGESRVVRLVSATYRANSNTNPDPQPPDIRPATFTISSSLVEVPATRWRKLGQVFVPNNPNDPFGNGAWEEALGAPEEPLNPVKDRYDGVATLVPIIAITIEQFDNFPTSRLDDSGKVNNDNFTFLGLPIGKFSCMLRGINVRPTVETFGSFTYRGYTRTFEFAVKTNGGWLIDQIVEGFNIKNDGLNQPGVLNEALNLEHVNLHVKEPLELAANTQGKKMRAMVPVSAADKKWMQRPSAQPVALNLDGTPRDVENPPNGGRPVLTQKYLTQGDVAFGNNFVNMGVRISEVI